MLRYLLIVGTMLRGLHACSNDAILVDSNSAVDANECGPFLSLDDAFTATAFIPIVELNVVSAETVLVGLWTIENQVQIIGLPSMLRMIGKVKVIGRLELVRMQLKEEGGIDPMLSCIGGVLHISESEVSSTTNIFVEHFSGEVEVFHSSFQGLAATAFVLRSVGCQLTLKECSFLKTADIVEIGWVSDEGHISLDGLQIATAGRLLYFAKIVQGTVQIRNSRVESSNELISGNLGNLIVEAFNLTVVDSRQIVKGSLTNSSFAFDGCSFLRIHAPPFDLSSLHGLLSIFHSNISEVNPGPVVLIPANRFQPSESLISISGCRISNVTNMSGSGGSVLGGLSVSFSLKNTEVWGIRVVEGGLFKLMAGVAEVSNVYYHDSSAVMFSFFENIGGKTTVSNILMTRVENDNVCFGMCLLGGKCYWNNVTITHSTDYVEEFGLAFNVCATAFYSVSIIRNSYFKNPGLTQLCVGVVDDSRLELYDSTFVETSAVKCVSALTRSTAIVSNVTFVDSKFDKLFNAYYCTLCLNLSKVGFRGNSSANTLILMDNAGVIIRDSGFDDIKESAIKASNSDLTIQNVSLSHLTRFVCEGCLNSRFNFSSLTVKHSVSPTLFDFSYSSVAFSDLRVQNATCSHFMWLDRCEVSIKKSLFADITVDSFGGLISATFSSILIELTQMTELFGTLSIHIGLIYLDSSPIVIADCSFNIFDSTLVYSVGSSVSITNSRFTDGGLFGANANKVVHSLGSVVWGVLAPSVLIANSTFEYLSADEGGAVYLVGSGIETCEISHITANYNRAERGGFLYSSQVFVKITESEFRSNTAQQGGVLWGAGSNGELLTKLESSRFLNNSASLDGGVLYHLQSDYLTSGCQWSFNTAQYGPNIASQISSFVALSNDTFETIENYTVEAVSGQFYDKQVTIGCLDQLGQIIRTDNKTMLNLFTKEANSSITISSLLEANQGIFAVQRMLVTGHPGSVLSVYGSNSKGLSTFIFFIRLRECIPGEEFTNMQCVPCTHNTYSFSPSELCHYCPNHASCPGGDRLILSSGYWRPSTAVADLFECLVPELCKGGYNSDCDAGHFGRMCNQCSTGYFKVNQLQCVICEGKGVAAVKDIASLVAGILSSLLALWRGDLLMHMAIFDYLHSMRVLVNFNIYWPDSLAYLYSVAGDVGSLGLTAFTDPCLGSITNIETVYSQLVVSVLFFSLLCVGVLVVCLVLRFVFQMIRPRMIIKVTLYLAYLMLPMLAMRALAMFPCFKIGSQHFLIYNPSVECWSPKHMYYTFGISVPVLLAAVFVPILLLTVGVLRARSVALPEWHYFCFAVFLLRKYALCCVLLFSNALRITTQVCFVIFLNLATEWSLYLFHKGERMFFFSFYEASLVSTTMLSFLFGIYSASASSDSEKQVALVLSSYVCLLIPAAYCGFLLYLKRRRIRKVVSVSRDQDQTIIPAQSDWKTSKSGDNKENTSQIFLRAPNPSPELSKII